MSVTSGRPTAATTKAHNWILPYWDKATRVITMKYLLSSLIGPKNINQTFMSTLFHEISQKGWGYKLQCQMRRDST